MAEGLTQAFEKASAMAGDTTFGANARLAERVVTGFYHRLQFCNQVAKTAHIVTNNADSAPHARLGSPHVTRQLSSAIRLSPQAIEAGDMPAALERVGLGAGGGSPGQQFFKFRRLQQVVEQLVSNIDQLFLEKALKPALLQVTGLCSYGLCSYGRYSVMALPRKGIKACSTPGHSNNRQTPLSACMARMHAFACERKHGTTRSTLF